MNNRQRTMQRTGRQQGVAAIWVGLFLVTLITVTFLAIDVGRLYFTQRQLQKLASLAAVAGTQVASGCSGNNADGAPGSVDAVTQLVETFLQSNDPNGVSYLTGFNGFAPVEIGTMVPQNGLRVFEPLEAGDPNISAVRVNLSMPQPGTFISFLTGGATLKASATAEQPLGGSFSVGSTLLQENAGTSPLLGPVLGGLLCPTGDTACVNSILALSVSSYATGLADVSVSVQQLATAVGVNVQDLSNPLDVTAPQVLNGLATVLNGTVSSNIPPLLQALGSAAGGNTTSFPLSSLLGTVTSVAGQVPVVDLLSLLTAVGEASKATTDGSVQPISLPLGLSVPNVATVEVFLRVLQAAQPNVETLDSNSILSGVSRPGTAQAHTSQIEIDIRIQLLPGLLQSLKTLLGSLITIPSAVNLGVNVTVAEATAYLDAIQCPSSAANGGSPLAKLSASPSVATITVGSFTGTLSATSDPALSTTGPVELLAIPAIPLVSPAETIYLNLTTVGLDTSSAPVALPLAVAQFDAQTGLTSGSPLIYDALGGPGVIPVVPVADNPQTVGSPENLTITLGITAEPSGSLINTTLVLVDSLLAPVTSLVDGLASSVIDPLLAALGIQAGTATVTMDAVLIGRPAKTSTCLPGGSGQSACQTAATGATP